MFHFIVGNEKDVSNKQESSKNRANIFYKIVEQLTLPLREGHTTTLDDSASGSAPLPDLSSDGDPLTEINVSILYCVHFNYLLKSKCNYLC